MGDFKNCDPEKTYFQPGDLVKLNKPITNAPEHMLVVKKETRIFKQENHTDDFLLGIKCLWFTKDN
ncbi:MAG: hypothetical protein Nk1A_8830 [Endomicrobiia bacterium]|nr:MAG: hypothetical protein Nk1A_8830 [Endomicrobiia bacterium]